MRFALVAFSAAALAALAGCSSPVPATPDGAWTVNMTNQGGTCMVSNSTRSIGTVTAVDPEKRITDGEMLTGGPAALTCSVSGTGTGPFSVDASLAQGADTLQIVIAAISAGATKTAPATGSVGYESDATVEEYQSPSCSFYFVDGTQEGVAAGKIWAAFTCAGITNGQSGSTCPVLESYVLFENCDQTPD
jgi:hypothetical protein